MSSVASALQEIYERLDRYFGPLNWWPAESPFEVVVGAVLTQNTNWKNVETAITSLKRAGLLSFRGLLCLSEDELARHIRSSGYYNLKARRLKNLLESIERDYGGDLELLFAEDTASARQALLSVNGIGPETADSILLYGGHHPSFVVDAYTHRILMRHNLIPEECDYRYIQDLFMDNLSHDPEMFNQYHALLVNTAKQFCRKSAPLCSGCPLEPML
ncbi:MAG: endonuclease III domain-containing protein [Desulfofustis sp.]